MRGAGRAGSGGNRRFGLGESKGRQCAGLRVSSARSPGLQLLNRERTRAPHVCAPSPSPSSHLGTADPGGKRAAAPCRPAPPRVAPRASGKRACFPGETRQPPAPRRSGEPLPRSRVGPAPSPDPDTYKGSWSLSPCGAHLAGYGHLQSHQSHESIYPPKNCPPHPLPPTSRASSPRSLSCGSGGRFPAASSPSDLPLPAPPSHLTCSPASADIPVAPLPGKRFFPEPILLFYLDPLFLLLLLLLLLFPVLFAFVAPTEHRNWGDEKR